MGEPTALHAEQFEKLTGANVEVVHSPAGDLYSKAMIPFQAGQAPYDIVFGFSNFIRDWMQYLEPVPEYYVNMRQMQDVTKSHIDVASWDGQMMQFPIDGELQRRFAERLGELRLRIGIASGPIILFEGEDYIGDAPNLASRLCDEAANYGILMPTEDAVHLPEGITAEPIGYFNLRGFDHPVHASRLVGLAPTTYRNDTGEHWTRTPFAV